MGKDKDEEEESADEEKKKVEKKSKKEKDKGKEDDGQNEKSKDKSDKKKKGFGKGLFKKEDENKENDEGIADIEEADGSHEEAEKSVTRTDRSTLSDKAEDFQIRVKVISGRQLSGTNIKPVVKVKAGKAQAKNTRIRKGSSPIWNELMMFNFHESLRDLYDFVFEFSVNNSRSMRSDSMIGSFKLDLGSVYDQPGHAYVRKWLLLTDLEDASNTPKGYLKITICVLGAGDQPPDEKSEGDDDDVEGNLLTPAGAALRSSNFTLRVYSAEDLPQMNSSSLKSLKKFIGVGGDEDSKSLVDPYMTFVFAGKKKKTKAKEESNNPDWNTELNLPIKFPSMCDSIKLNIKNKNRIGSDDAISEVVIPMSKISSTGEGDDDEGFLPTFGPTFVNFYGSPREHSKDDSLNALNAGKGEGCSYRGRAMVELSTTLEEEGSEPVPPKQPINEEQLESILPYCRRERYRLVVGFESASMIEKKYDNLEFEVSMGNYGNKFDSGVSPVSSLTEPTSPVSDGCKYYFIPWASKKPVMMVTSQWEDINFRLSSVNAILNLCDEMERGIIRINRVLKDNGTEMDVAEVIVALLDRIIIETSKKLPGLDDHSSSNQLDILLRQQRMKVLEAIWQEAQNLRLSCTDASQAIEGIYEFLDKLKNIAYEPQNSIPDVIIWMISGKKRIAYYRIPAHDILYSHDKPEYCGRFCSKPRNIFLRVPNAKATSKKRYQIPCQVRISAWFGLAKAQDDFKFDNFGDITVCDDTYEFEMKIPIKGWVPDGFKDRSGEFPLKKESFVCPRGWEWEGDWELGCELSLLRDAEDSSYLEECFEYMNRGMDWEPDKVVNIAGDSIEGPESILCPKGWEWEDEWTIDTQRACDEDGWEYTVPSDEEGKEDAWSSLEKEFHTTRRRRIVRNRKQVDKKAEISEGWEYAIKSSSKFHPKEKITDFSRRRKWIRKMVPSSKEGSSAIFSLDKTVIPDTTDDPSTSSAKVESAAVTTVDDAIPEERTDEPPSSNALTSTDEVAADDIELQPPDSNAPSVDESSELQSQEIADKEVLTEGEPKDTTFKRKLSKQKSLRAKIKPERKKKMQMPAPKIYIMYNTSSKLQLRSYIYQGRDLIPMGKDNFSDPVLFVSFMNHCSRTVVVCHNLNPTWDQTLMMDITFYGDLRLLQKYCNDVVLEVFDKAGSKFPSVSLGKKSSTKSLKGKLKFMGRTLGQPLIKFDTNDEQSSRLHWLDVKKGDLSGGSILVAFELYLNKEDEEMPLPPPRRNDLYIVPFGIRPVLQRTAIEILIWGVRNMQSFKLLSVDTPMVLIQVGDLEIRTKALKSVKKNPNFPQPLYFATANLPIELLYFPPIVIRVKDNRKFGRRPTVGQHVIVNVSKYRIEPIKPKTEEDDEGYDQSLSDSSSRSSSVGDVSIEIDQPAQEESVGFLERVTDGISKTFKDKTETHVREEEVDWWSKYYASLGETDKCGEYLDSGLDLMKIYKNELEQQENFDNFSDFIETFKLMRGKVKEDEDPEFAGEFKGSIRIYELPADLNEELPPRVFQNLPPTTPVNVKVRIYVVRAFQLASIDSSDLADPYLKIKYGKKRMEDRKNYIPNTLDPIFGKIFDLDVKLPMEKDLYVQVYDWNLIGTDDKIGETVIDLENRYLSKYRAWCSLPESYYTSGPTPWRDQMTPKDWLNDKARREGWDEPIWNGNTCVLMNGKTYKLNHFETGKKPSPYWGEPEERLSLYILRTFPHVSEHVETRPLYSKVLPGIEQGRLQLWVDMFPKEYGDPGEPFNIAPRQPSKYFVRVIIWNCSDIPMMDTSIVGDPMTDIYFKGWLTGLEHKKRKTDVHYRSMDGTGMFNWRLIFPFEYIPQERLIYVSKKEHLWSLDKTVSKFPPVLNIQVWDNDVFGPNEYISEISLPLNKTPRCSKFQRRCTLDNIPDNHGNCKMDVTSMFDQKLLKGWWPLYRMVDGERQQAGKLEMSVEIVTDEEHEERPAGQGRQEPNLNPKLEKPKRPATSFAWFSSPFKSLRYIIWRKYKWIIIGLLVLILVVVFIVLLLYSIPGALARLI